MKLTTNIKLIFKITTLVSLTLFSLFANSQVLCFISDKPGEQKAQLRVNIFSDGQSGTVRYRQQRNDLQIQLKNEKSASPKNSPAVAVSRWTESFHGREIGEYEFTTIGAIIGKLRYIRRRDGRIFLFFDDRNAYAIDDCEWNK